MDSAIVKELIQQDCTSQTVGDELSRLINDGEYRNEMLANYRKLDKRMGNAGASVKTAELIIKYLIKLSSANC